MAFLGKGFGLRWKNAWSVGGCLSRPIGSSS